MNYIHNVYLINIFARLVRRLSRCFSVLVCRLFILCESDDRIVLHNMQSCMRYVETILYVLYSSLNEHFLYTCRGFSSFIIFLGRTMRYAKSSSLVFLYIHVHSRLNPFVFVCVYQMDVKVSNKVSYSVFSLCWMTRLRFSCLRIIKIGLCILIGRRGCR